MKKALLLSLLTLFSICAFVSCSRGEDKNVGKQDEENKVHIDENTFYLPDGLPEIGEFSGAKNNRFYDTIQTEFVSSDDYGLVLPYIAQSRVFETPKEEEWRTQMRYSSYGICNADGKIIADPPQGKSQYIGYNESEDGFGVYCITSTESDSVRENDEFFFSDYTFIPINGKWSMSFDENTWISYIGGGYIYFCSYPKENDYNSVIKVYDYDGNYCKTLEGVDNVFGITSDSLMLTSGFDDDGNYEVYFRNSKNEVVLGPYDNAMSFDERQVTYVSDENGRYLINRKGERVSEYYDHMSFNASSDGKRQCFVARRKNNDAENESKDMYNYYFFDADGKLIGECLIDKAGYVSLSISNNGEIVYGYSTYDTNEDGTPNWSTQRYAFYRLSDHKKIFNEEYGVSPNDFSNSENYYVYRNDEEKIAVLMDSFGNTILAIDDFYELGSSSEDGKYFVYQTGEYDAEYNREEKIYDIKTDTRKMHVYDVEKKKEEACFDLYGYSSFIDGAGSRYLKIEKSSEQDFFGGLSKNWIYDTQKHEFIFEDCDEIGTYCVLGKVYFNVSKDNCFCLYDENLNVIIKNYYE